MISTNQIRAARAFLRWTVKDLASVSGVSVPTIHRMEQEDGVPSGRSQTLSLIQTSFEKVGIEFIGTPQNGAGVRFKPTEKGSQV